MVYPLFGEILQSGGDRLARLINFINKLDRNISALVLGLMMIVGFFNVLSRYLLDFSLASSEELLTNLLVFLTLMASAAGIQRDAHVGVSFIVDLFPRKIRISLSILKIITFLIFFGILFKFGLDNMFDALKYGQRTTSLGVPSWIFSAALPLGGLFCLLEAMGKFKDLKK